MMAAGWVDEKACPLVDMLAGQSVVPMVVLVAGGWVESWVYSTGVMQVARLGCMRGQESVETMVVGKAARSEVPWERTQAELTGRRRAASTDD